VVEAVDKSPVAEAEYVEKGAPVFAVAGKPSYVKRI